PDLLHGPVAAAAADDLQAPVGRDLDVRGREPLELQADGVARDPLHVEVLVPALEHELRQEAAVEEPGGAEVAGELPARWADVGLEALVHEIELEEELEARGLEPELADAAAGHAHVVVADVELGLGAPGRHAADAALVVRCGAVAALSDGVAPEVGDPGADVQLVLVLDEAARDRVGLLEGVEAEETAHVDGVLDVAEPEGREEPACARVPARRALAPHREVLARDEVRRERDAGARGAAVAEDAGEREAAGGNARVEVGLHREGLDVRAVEGVLVLGDRGEASVAAEREPRRELDEALPESTVAAHRDRVAGVVAAGAIDEPAAGGRVVTLAAADRAGRELELRVGPGERGRGDDHEGGGEAHHGGHGDPSSTQRAMRLMSACGSG